LPTFKALEYEAAPDKFVSMPYYDKGVVKELYVNRDYARQLMPGSGNPKVLNALSWLSGAKVLKFLATGINPEFALKNVPLDILHIATTQRIYDDIVGAKALKNNMPLSIFAIHKDIVFNLATLGPKVKEYYKYYGGMEHMLSGGEALLKSGKYNIKNEMGRKLFGALEFMGNTSELITRVSLMERTIGNEIADFKKTNNREPNAREMELIKFRGAQTARNYLDFSQKGTVGQYIDAIFPYFNAGLQVTRGTYRAFLRDPGVMAAKVSQFIGLSMAIQAYNSGKIHPMFHTLDADDQETKQLREEMAYAYDHDINDRLKASNLIIMSKNNWIDKEGRKHFHYFAIPIDNSVQWIKSLGEETFRSTILGKDFDFGPVKAGIKSIFKNVPDVIGSPTLRAMIGAEFNMDTYFKRPVYSGYEEFQKWDRELEINQGYTKDAYIKFAQAVGLSPARTQFVAEQLLTSQNIFVNSIEGLVDWAIPPSKYTAGENKTQFQSDWAKLPIVRKLIKTTRPERLMTANEEETEVQKMRKSNNLQLENRLFSNNNDMDSVLTFIQGVSEKDPAEAKRLSDKVKETVMKRDVSGFVVDLMDKSSLVRAKTVYREMMKNPVDKRQEYYDDLMKECEKLQSKNPLNEQFFDAFMQIHKMHFLFINQDKDTRRKTIKDFEEGSDRFLSKKMLEEWDEEADKLK
jgi:hypothetical protein